MVSRLSAQEGFSRDSELMEREMFVSQVPLVEFYKNLLPAAESAGYKLLLTVLAREADSPSFYEDVRRYWTSLHDATGSDVLFVFAGANAARELDERGVRHRRGSIAVPSHHAALAGDVNKRAIRWDGPFHQPDTFRPRPELGKGQPHLDKEDIATHHTLEMYALRRFLGIQESQLPCLVFLLLNRYHARSFLIFPLSTLGQSTLYQYVKELSAALEDGFQIIDEVRQSIANLRKSEGKGLPQDPRRPALCAYQGATTGNLRGPGSSS